uniref:RING-type domain-containing protein n=1 Tax=Oncorhynchus mykiss TaxID=8022 RepID=A0A8C7PT97_ONCMY
MTSCCATSLWLSDGQTPEGDPEPEEAERCPICLGALGRCVLAMPDSCCHVFCLSCLLRWAEGFLRWLYLLFHNL